MNLQQKHNTLGPFNLSMLLLQEIIAAIDKGIARLGLGAGIAQLVEGPTEKPAAILTRVRVPGTARNFSPRVSFQCTLMVF